MQALAKNDYFILNIPSLILRNLRNCYVDCFDEVLFYKALSFKIFSAVGKLFPVCQNQGGSMAAVFLTVKIKANWLFLVALSTMMSYLTPY